MKRYVSLAIIVILAISLQTHASGPYISISGGATLTEAEDRAANSSERDDKGYNGEGAAGFSFRSADSDAGFREELAYTYNDIDDDMELSSIMFNSYFDIYTDTAVTPYFLFGLGRAEVESGSYEKSSFSFQLGAGIGYSITENVIADLKYAYFRTDLDNIDVRLSAQKIQLGLRYMF